MEAAPLPWKSGFRWDPAGLSLPSEDGLQCPSYGAALRLKETVRGGGVVSVPRTEGGSVPPAQQGRGQGKGLQPAGSTLLSWLGTGLGKRRREEGKGGFLSSQ